MAEPQRKLDTYGAQEMAIPEVRLLQKTGGDWAKQLGGQPGQFHNTVSDEIFDELHIIVADILTGRAKWGAEIQSSGPECASLDAGSETSVFGDDCTLCPDRLNTPWALDASQRRTRCCPNYAILGIDIDHDNLPVLIRAHGISALPARQLITQLRTNRALRGDYHRAVVNIKSEAKDTRYGTAYAMRPRIARLITDEAKAEELKAESDRLLGATIPLPEGRPEEEQALGFTPGGAPVYSEEERDRLLAEETAPAAPKPEPGKEEETPKDETGPKVDLDF